MSTSAVYSPHPSTANLPSSDATATSPITKPSRYPPGRSASSRNGKSVSPTRTAAVSTRSSRRSQSSKSPEKMPPPTSTSSPHSSNNRDDHDHTTATNGHVTDDVDMADHHADDSEGEPEIDDMDDDGNGTVHTTGSRKDTAADPDVPTKAAPNKIKLVLNAHKRKGSSGDAWEAVSSSRNNTPDTGASLDAGANHSGPLDENVAVGVGPASSVAAASTPGESRAEAQPPLSDQTLIIPSNAADTHAYTTTATTTTITHPPADTNVDTATDTAAGTATATPNAEASSTPAPDDKPKRAPRKRRKWLRKGEVDPDDPKAVAEQKARHALIDSAIEALNQQEQLILDETHPQLIELWDELTRRRDRLHQYNKAGYDAKAGELARLHKLEMAHHRSQFRADCNDLADAMTFEIARKKARLTAEKVYHDQQDGRPTTKRMYTNMPMLGEGRGCGGWWRPPTALLSDKSEPTTRVVKDGVVRKRRRVDLGPRQASRQDIMDDLIDLGLVEQPESSPEPESAEEAEEEVFEIEPPAPPAPMPARREPSPEPIPSLLPPPPVRSVPPPVPTPTPGPPPMPMPPPPDMYTSPPLPMRPSQSPSASFAPPPLAMPRGPPPLPPRDRGPPPGPPLLPAERPKWDEYYPPRDDEPLHRRPYQPGQPGDRTWYHRPPYPGQGPGPGPGPGPSHGHGGPGGPPPPRGPQPGGGPGGPPGGPPGSYYYDRPWYPPPPVPMGPPQTATATGPPPPPEPPTATMPGDSYWGRGDHSWRMRDPYGRLPENRSQPPAWELRGSAPAGYATSRP